MSPTSPVELTNHEMMALLLAWEIEERAPYASVYDDDLCSARSKLRMALAANGAEVPCDHGAPPPGEGTHPLQGHRDSMG